MRSLVLATLASWLAGANAFFFGNLFPKTKPSYKYKPSYRPGSSIFRPSLPIEDWKPQYGQYGPNDFVPTSTEPETDEKPQYFDDKPMYIKDEPVYVNVRPKPKPIFPQIQIPPFDVLRHFLAKLALLKNHFLGKLNFFGGIFGSPPNKHLYKPKPGYRPRPSYKPRPNRPTRKPTPSKPTTTLPTITARPSYSTPSDSYGAPWGDLLPVATTRRPSTSTKPPRSTFFPWPPRPPSSGYGAPWDDLITPSPNRSPSSTSPPRKTTTYPSLTLPPFPPLDSYGAPLGPLLPSDGTADQPLIYDNLIGPRFPEDQRPSAKLSTTPTPWRLGSNAYTQVNRQPPPAPQTFVVQAAKKAPKKIGPAVAPLDGYGAPLATVVTTPQPIISVASEAAAATTLITELPGVEAARAVRPLDGYGAPQGLVVGIKSNQKGEEVTPTPEPDVPEGFQSSHNQWEPMTGPHQTGVSRSMRMEDKDVEGHTVRAQFKVEGDPTQTLTEWVITPNPGYRPAAVTGASVQMSPPTQDRGDPWDKGESNEVAEMIETTTTEDVVEPSFENLRDLMVESTTKKTELEDTLYTIFLEIMNQTMAANFETTTPTLPGRPESIEDIISFIKDVTNNTESFRSQQTKDLTDNDLPKVVDTSVVVTSKSVVTHDASTEEPETTTTERKHVKEEDPQTDKASSHFIMGQGINGFITGIVRLQEDARFLYDPKTGTLVGKEKRRS